MTQAEETLRRFIPYRLDTSATCQRIALASASLHAIGQSDLFSYAGADIAESLRSGGQASSSQARFKLGNGLVVELGNLDAPPASIQSLLAALSARALIGQRYGGQSDSVVVDPLIGLQLREADPEACAAAIDLWMAISDAAATHDNETATTPKLYGSKLRLTQLLVGAACTVLPEGAPILDAMAGTGIVTRKFSGRFEVSANDANPYAALLSRAQGAKVDSVDGLLSRIKEVAHDNFSQLARLAPIPFATEVDFLHGEATEERLEAYRQFCSNPVLAPGGAPALGSPHQLVVARYANIYFGLTQAAQLDSLRAAIEAVTPGAGDDRDLGLAALITAASVCSTGPHFAQPLKIATVDSFRQIIERRARSVLWEFELALRRLAARPALKRPICRVTNVDWRIAVEAFLEDIGARRPAAVYFDPPYSKLQYSRFYHVLNVLVAYDYPQISGVGRYPPLSSRFSSRFENNAEPAMKEFRQAFEVCRSRGLHAIVSYSDRGFVPIDELTTLMQSAFKEVIQLSEGIRHHSQGVRLGKHQGHITEFVLIGQP